MISDCIDVDISPFLQKWSTALCTVDNIWACSRNTWKYSGIIYKSKNLQENVQSDLTLAHSQQKSEEKGIESLVGLFPRTDSYV